MLVHYTDKVLGVIGVIVWVRFLDVPFDTITRLIAGHPYVKIMGHGPNLTPRSDFGSKQEIGTDGV